MDGLKALRSYFELIVDIPDEQWNAITPIFKEKSFSKGSLFVSSGTMDRDIGFVLSGLFKEYYLTEAGGEFIKDFAAEGEFVGNYVADLLDQPSTHDVEAMEESRVLTFRYMDFAKFFDSHGCWDRIGRVSAEKLLVDREKREFDLLTKSAAERYETFLQLYPKLVDRIPLNQIASYLGIKPQSLSRLRKN